MWSFWSCYFFHFYDYELKLRDALESWKQNSAGLTPAQKIVLTLLPPCTGVQVRERGVDYLPVDQIYRYRYNGKEQALIHKQVVYCRCMLLVWLSRRLEICDYVSLRILVLNPSVS